MRYADRFIGIEFQQRSGASLLKASQQPPGTVPVGVPVSTADGVVPCQSSAARGCAIVRVPEENRETSNDLDSGLAPVTPEAAGSSPVDPANYNSQCKNEFPFLAGACLRTGRRRRAGLFASGLQARRD